MKHFKISAVVAIIIANIAMFIVQSATGGISGWFTQNLMLISSDVFTRPWILVTSMFLHGSIWHLFFNVYVLFIFGSLVEQAIGTRRFIGLYFISGILAAFIPTYTAALGASGAVMGVVGMTIMLFPHLQVLFFFIIPMSMRTFGIVIVVIETFFMINPFETGIAHFAHLVGLACGLGYGNYLLKKKKDFTRRFAQGPYSSQAIRRDDERPKSKKGGEGAAHKSSDIEMSDEDVENYLRYGRI